LLPKLSRFIALLAAAPALLRPQSTGPLLARLDEAARKFTGATAHLRSVHHLPIIDPDDTEIGVITVRRAAPDKVHYLVEFTAPDPKAMAVRDQKVEVYYPKRNEIEEWNIAKYRDFAQALLLLGFGMPGRELAANYEIRIAGVEKIGPQAATHLELTPKSARVRAQVNRIDLWISEETGFSLQQKFSLPGGEYRMNTFTELRLNPKLPPSAMDLPKGAKRIKMN